LSLQNLSATSGGEVSFPDAFAGPARVRVSRQELFPRALRARQLKQSILGASFLGFLAAAWFYPLLGYFIPVCMAAGIGVAAFQGRSWCNWLCPRGSFLDAWLQKISRGRRIPEFFRRPPLRLAVMALLLSVLTLQLIRLWPDPWAIGGFFVVLLTVTTAVAVVLGVIYQQRTWCYLCPIGTMSAWVGKNRRPLALEAVACFACRRCSKTCPMQLSPQELKGTAIMAHRGDCLKCGLCLAACPTAALRWDR